mmetsp:Transcript_24531/g.32863  ORF Transcript_24531/g.32863 Transcript_24531/m.32863 type:complete len:97 (-) Transcript_24531:197-487(-)
MNESDYEKAEKKLVRRFDEKMSEMREALRMDRNDFNNKLATFKSDVGSMTFEKSVHNFLRDTVYTGWREHKDRSKALETELEEYRIKQLRIVRKLN